MNTKNPANSRWVQQCSCAGLSLFFQTKIQFQMEILISNNPYPLRNLGTEWTMGAYRGRCGWWHASFSLIVGALVEHRQCTYENNQHFDHGGVITQFWCRNNYAKVSLSCCIKYYGVPPRALYWFRRIPYIPKTLPTWGWFSSALEQVCRCVFQTKKSILNDVFN